jgi:hypothetical protein
VSLRTDPKRAKAARKAHATRRRDDDAMSGRMTTEPGIPCPVCTTRCRIDHTAQGYSFLVCRVCGASNQREHPAPA